MTATVYLTRDSVIEATAHGVYEPSDRGGVIAEVTATCACGRELVLTPEEERQCEAALWDARR